MKTLDELAAEQNVKPITNPKALFFTWPGDAHDGFEELINEARGNQHD